MRSPLPTLVVLTVSILAASCSSRNSEPAADATVRQAVPQQPSTIAIDVAIPLEPLVRQVNDQIPVVIEKLDAFEMDESGRFGVKYRIQRDQIRIGMRGSLLRSTTTFRYGLTGCLRTRTSIRSATHAMWPCVSCGMNEPLREAAAVLDSRIWFDSSWRIRSETTAQPVVLRDDCSVTLLNIDVSRWKVAPFIDDQLQQTARTIDARIAADTTLQRQVESVWKTLGTPMEIAPRIWLSIAPEAIALGALSGEGSAVTTTLDLRARPSIVVGTKPAASALSLPSPGQAQPGSGLEVGFQTILPFSEAASLLERQFARPAASTHPFRISNVAMKSGRTDEVIFTARAAFDQPLGGRYDGPITLRGRPSFDASTQTIYVADLDYSLDAPGLRSRIADLVLHGQFRNRLEAAARWPIGPRIEQLRRELDAALKRPVSPAVQLSGNIASVRVLDLEVGSGRFVIPAIASGTLKVTLMGWR